MKNELVKQTNLQQDIASCRDKIGSEVTKAVNTTGPALSKAFSLIFGTTVTCELKRATRKKSAIAVYSIRRLTEEERQMIRDILAENGLPNVWFR